MIGNFAIFVHCYCLIARKIAEIFSYNCDIRPLHMQLFALMSWVEGLFCAFWMLALESNFTMPQHDFYAKIGISRGDMGQILAQWQYPVASRIAWDFLYWGICSALHQRIVMASEMASEGGVFCVPPRTDLAKLLSAKSVLGGKKLLLRKAFG